MLLIKNFFNLVFGNFGISQSSAKALLIRLPGITEISLKRSYQDILTSNGTTYVIFWKEKIDIPGPYLLVFITGENPGKVLPT